MEAEWTRERAFLIAAATDGRVAARQGALLVRDPGELIQWLGGPYVGEPAVAPPVEDGRLVDLHQRVMALEQKLANLHDSAYLAPVVQPPRLPLGPVPAQATPPAPAWPPSLAAAPVAPPTRAWRDLFLANEQRR